MRVVSFEIISNNTLRILKHDVQYSSFNCIMLVHYDWTLDTRLC